MYSYAKLRSFRKIKERGGSLPGFGVVVSDSMVDGM